MAKQEKETPEAIAPDTKKLRIANPSVDWPIQVESLEDDIYHDNGEVFDVGSKKAVQLATAGRVKVVGSIPPQLKALANSTEETTYKKQANDLIVALKKLGAAIVVLMLFSFTAIAQNPASLKSPYLATSDTVTNTGTAYLTSAKVLPALATSTTIWVAVTKISGTVGGTITLQGSMDGTNFKAVNTPDTQTALATITATDASNTYHWRLDGSPFQYYRVSWTGTGTMSASFTAQIMRAR